MGQPCRSISHNKVTPPRTTPIIRVTLTNVYVQEEDLYGIVLRSGGNLGQTCTTWIYFRVGYPIFGRIKHAYEVEYALAIRHYHPLPYIYREHLYNRPYIQHYS